MYKNDKGEMVFLSKQQAAVLEYMDSFGSIMRPQAYDLFIFNLPDVIMRLREKGFEILSVFPDGKRWCKYVHKSTGNNVLL